MQQEGKGSVEIGPQDALQSPGEKESEMGVKQCRSRAHHDVKERD